MGMGVVFIGLICIIFLIWLLGKVLDVLIKDKPEQTKSAAAPVAAAPVDAVIENRSEFVAAVSAAIAEDLGTDISKLQIVSIKKL